MINSEMSVYIQGVDQSKKYMNIKHCLQNGLYFEL